MIINFLKNKKIIPLLLIGLFLSLPVSALNLKDSFSDKGSLPTFSKNAGFLPKELPVESYIGLVIAAFFSILGIISIILIIYSGFTWMTARGNESQVTKAKENLYNVIIGLIFIVGAYALTAFLLKIFI